MFVNEQQNNQVELLPNTQFVINSTCSNTIEETLFFANYGYQLVLYNQPRKDIEIVEVAIQEANTLRVLYKQIHKDIEFANIRIAKSANKKRVQKHSYKEGDKVYLLQQNIKTKRPSNKLDFKRLGLFKVRRVVGRLNCKLELPRGLQLYLVFYILLLELVPSNTPIQAKTKLQLEQGLVVYNVERILVERIRNKRKEYLVKWLGYEDVHNFQELEGNLSYFEKLVKYQLVVQRTSRRRNYL